MGRVRVLLKTGAILTVFERPSNKTKISLSESSAKRRTAVEKRQRLWYNTHITVSCT